MRPKSLTFFKTKVRDNILFNVEINCKTVGQASFIATFLFLKSQGADKQTATLLAKEIGKLTFEKCESITPPSK